MPLAPPASSSDLRSARMARTAGFPVYMRLPTLRLATVSPCSSSSVLDRPVMDPTGGPPPM
eukprot:9657487-Lingulodinium_polyedra.AAC.1